MQQDQPLMCWPSLCGWCVMRSQFLSGCGEWDPKSNIVPLSYFIMSLSSHGILNHFGAFLKQTHWDETHCLSTPRIGTRHHSRMIGWPNGGCWAKWVQFCLVMIILPITWEIGNFGPTYRERWASFLWGRCVSCFFLLHCGKVWHLNKYSYSMTGSFKLKISKVHGGRQHVYNFHVKLQLNCEIRSSCDIQLTYRVVILHTDTEPEVWPSPE